MEFLYKIGEECWLVQKGFGVQIYRCQVTAQILERTEKGEFEKYKIKLNHNSSEIECKKDNLFDVATRSKDAITTLISILSK